jgi:uracil-DNA glycosylase
MPVFQHAGESQLPAGPVLISSYHPSQQNTLTGKLTHPMFDRIFERAREILK